METLTFRRPRLVALILLVLISAGLSSFLSLGRQEDPTITNLFATVTTSFPGADPARVEALVTAEIEAELREIAEVDTLESVSRSGVSVVSIELLETLDEATIEQVWSEARDAVEDARRTFPTGVQAPEFNAEGISAYSAVIAVTSDHDAVPLSLAYRHAETLASRLRAIPSTRAVDLFGTPEEEVLVEVDPSSAAALGLSIDEISTRVAAADGKVQAGRLQGGGSDLTINISGEIEQLARLRDVVLRENAEGASVTLGDVAQIARAPRDPATELALANGRPAILVGVLAQDGVQIDRWMGFVREELAAGSDAVPVGLSEVLMFDQSTYTADRLAEVGTNMAIGVALVVAVLFVTLGVRAAAVVALVLPVVSLATLATMNFIGLPIHQMSVTGLIVALGLLVDAAIVMSDEVRQRLARGMARIDAVGDAVKRLAAPLLASTVTTALSFTPMILLPGPAGDFVGSIAIAVVLMLLWSLFVALTVTPALAGWVLPAAGRGSFLSRGVSWPTLAKVFEASVFWAVRNPVKSIAVSLILPVLGFAAFPTLTAQFFPGVDRDQFYLEVEMPPGTAISDTAAISMEIDAILQGEPDIASVYWSIGQSGPAFYYNITGGRSQEPGYAQAMITSASPAASARLVPELQERLDLGFPDARITVRGLVQGPPVAAPVELRLVGPDLDLLRAQGDELRAIMADLDLTTQVRAGVTGGAPQVRFEIDEVAARLLGLDVSDIARQLEAGLVGVTGGSLVEGTEQLPVRARFDTDTRGDLAAISDLPILLPGAATLSASGQFPAVPLSELATPVLEPAESVITRFNGERANTVQAFIVPGVLPEEALQSVLAALDEGGFQLAPGYRMELGGDSNARSSTVGNLLASIGVIVTLTIATIALTFNSFRLTAVALVVCGLSAGLSMLALAVMQYPFGINAIIGVIGSIGVSINAAIIILTGLKADPEAAAGGKAAMARVVTGSSRHITSTTITTFGGFLPLILQGGGFWPPFAVAIAGGVLLSTVVSFYFTPPMFALLYRERQKTAIVASRTKTSEPLILRHAAE
ncbi:MMPL family transporter [Roseobacter sp. HKCCD9010]|uniref:efflux RND transporter permease subunit n=1 Tax=unclassified Roseobacter TaxID=196798 RepID=UPI0014913273|nr:MULTISPECIES: efflux RND transporter permease subunit [unclassified Roseobacter]MBF9048830.1 MMPL family transporter [Rhodobacterales bacterium HKCCD4356]NNV10829.1 MMPL family transporter [Roseobacter sp. HKCCD7357]NNV15014.1 MMPL family transporter [Roseobacter sp. HKCCD8768]NNV24473.1 MMPL family transporter [Roseobacter sp. HKCCD8192]NNV28730.1 MMPL family transporter [Roseobacter sp. HKCCD9061]